MYQVISGQQLPKVNIKEGSIVDPLVRVEIHGVPMDQAKQETRYIENNGKGKTELAYIWSHRVAVVSRHECRKRKVIFFPPLFVQGSTPCGTTLFASPSILLSWPWCALWWKTTTKRQKMTLWGSTRCLSAACSKVSMDKLSKVTGIG